MCHAVGWTVDSVVGCFAVVDLPAHKDKGLTVMTLKHVVAAKAGKSEAMGPAVRATRSVSYSSHTVGPKGCAIISSYRVTSPSSNGCIECAMIN